jgi:hypothetical protein
MTFVAGAAGGVLLIAPLGLVACLLLAAAVLVALLISDFLIR